MNEILEVTCSDILLVSRYIELKRKEVHLKMIIMCIYKMNFGWLFCITVFRNFWTFWHLSINLCFILHLFKRGTLEQCQQMAACRQHRWTVMVHTLHMRQGGRMEERRHPVLPGNISDRVLPHRLLSLLFWGVVLLLRWRVAH